MATITTKVLKRGDTWNPSFEITQDNIAFNCTDYVVKMWIKGELSETATELVELTATWTSQITGKGEFKLTHAVSKTLPVKTLFYEVKLYEDDSNFTLVATFREGILRVKDPLEADLT